MTLVELMVATGLASILLLVLGSLTLYSARSFSAMVNYTDLNQDSRAALDRISKEIRQSRGVLNRTPTSLLLSLDGGKTVTYSYNAAKKELTEDKGAGIKSVLENCTYWTNQLYRQIPQSGNFDFYSTTNPSLCKMIQITWICESPTKNQKNTADVQSMKVVIRKKPN